MADIGNIKSELTGAGIPPLVAERAAERIARHFAERCEQYAVNALALAGAAEHFAKLERTSPNSNAAAWAWHDLLVAMNEVFQSDDFADAIAEAKRDAGDHSDWEYMS